MKKFNKFSEMFKYKLTYEIIFGIVGLIIGIAFIILEFMALIKFIKG